MLPRGIRMLWRSYAGNIKKSQASIGFLRFPYLGVSGFSYASDYPVISGFWPGTGPPGARVFIFGDHFIPMETQVSVNSVTAPLLQVVDSTLAIFVLPESASGGPVTVTTSLGSAMSTTDFGTSARGTP